MFIFTDLFYKSEFFLFWVFGGYFTPLAHSYRIVCFGHQLGSGRGFSV